MREHIMKNTFVKKKNIFYYFYCYVLQDMTYKMINSILDGSLQTLAINSDKKLNCVLTHMQELCKPGARNKQSCGFSFPKMMAKGGKFGGNFAKIHWNN